MTHQAHVIRENTSIHAYTNCNKKKLSPVKKGALIGAGLKAGIDVLVLSCSKNNLKTSYKETFKQTAKVMGMSNKKFAVFAAIDIAIFSLVGAGIGKIIQLIKKPAVQEENIKCGCKVHQG